jgi:putative ABC transport system permease protein
VRGMRLWFRRRDTDLVEEIDTHLSLLEQQYREAGMAPAAARDAARREFGSVLVARQLYREQRVSAWLEALVQDARFGIRLFKANRGFALVATIVLGLGIGVNNMMFTIIYAHTLRGLPLPEADRVLMGSFTDERGADMRVAWLELEELRSALEAFGPVAALGSTVPIGLGDAHRAPDRYNATYVTANAFDTLGIRLLGGRSFTPAEELDAHNAVALLGARAWRARYGGDPGVVGREILVDGREVRVVGIVPERSGFPSTAEVWLPISRAPGWSHTDRDARVVRMVARVRDGVAVEQARAEIGAVMASIGSREGGNRFIATVTPVSDGFFGRPTDPAWLAFITAGLLVFLVSCANVANLMLARGAYRVREMAIRGSLGASGPRLFLQVLTESVVIALAGSAIGFGLSLGFVRVFRSFIPADALPYWLHYSMDATVFVALVVAGFGSVLFFGWLPAGHASNTDTLRALRHGGWSGSDRATARRWTTGFMTAQIALAVVLLAQGVNNWVHEPGPTDADRAILAHEILAASISVSGERYGTAEQRTEFFQTLASRLRGTSGVTNASLTSALPRAGAAEQRLQLAVGDATSGDELPRIWVVSIAPGYFATLNVSFVEGRDFHDGDTADRPGVAIVNRRFVALFSPDEPAIGRQVAVVNPAVQATRTVTIVGVTPDMTHRDSRDPVVYLPVAVTAPSVVQVLVRSRLEPGVATRVLRDVVLALDANLPVFRTMTLERAIRDAGWTPRVSSLLFTTLLLIVLTLSGVGLHATTTQMLAQQRKELGIRVAVGARSIELCRVVARRAAVPITLGLALGIPGALGWVVVFGAENAGSTTGSLLAPGVLLLVAVVLTATMAAACVRPLWQAARLDPVHALRED